MDNVQIDLSTVVVAAVLNMVIGYLWYSKWLFGAAWSKLCHGHGKQSDCNNKTSLFYAAVVSLVIAYFLAFFETYLGITTVTDGMFVGFCIWLGFVATSEIGAVIWSHKSFKLFALHSGCKLLSYLVMSGVIGA